ncbi:uncharacterized protein LOC110034111 [Phalaenopsis equestris]|uniref:uncharacterized protein LOC110034111 n=1 Tax=Phalaenopsis equestris TaxID=78828 RepID=UPI0009E34CB6|nr:uncharacterized protein LOC110034111 [Phalaenopsis equestris]
MLSGTHILGFVSDLDSRRLGAAVGFAAVAAVAAVGTPSKSALAFSFSSRSFASGRASSVSSAAIGVTLAWRRGFDSCRIITAVRSDGSAGPLLRTCKNCKAQFDPSINHPGACRFHTAHFGGRVHLWFVWLQPLFLCCGSEDPFDPGCTAAPHSSYDE